MKIEVSPVINELRIKQNLTREELAKDICEPIACQIMKEVSLLQPLMNWHFLRINLKLTCRISSLPKMNRSIIT